MPQLVTRISHELAADLDRLVKERSVASRSEAVRLGLEALIEARRRASIGQLIADGYRRIPPEDGLDVWAGAAGSALIEAEPW